MSHSHRYTQTACPECGADLTRPDSVQASFSVWNRTFDLHTRLDSQGVLQEPPGHDQPIAKGLHAGTSCAACGDNGINDCEGE